MSLDLTYTALASRKVDMIAGNSTDGRIASLDLVQLEDDRHYFPPYEAVFIVRRDVKDVVDTGVSRPTPLDRIMNELTRAISTDEMRQLNYEVDGAKRDKKIVVHEWLVKKGFVKSEQ
jgi:glycine betaine/choline ABC-type transport system substrate-binding protein